MKIRHTLKSKRHRGFPGTYFEYKDGGVFLAITNLLLRVRMKYIVVALSIFSLISFIRADTKYTDKFDKIDIDSLIKNERLFKSYVNCLLDKGPCRPEGLELKATLPDALLTECQKCTETQKGESRKIIRHLIQNQREWWNELESKYDPKKVYVTKYSEELKKEGIVL